MSKRRFTIALMGAICALALIAAATPASAGLAFLAHNGTGATCTLAAPCAQMTSALTVAGANGEVICLDKGYYGGAQINQSVTISCGYGLWEANGSVAVSLPAGSNAVIEGLVDDGTGSNFQPVTMVGQGTLHLRNVRVGNFAGTGNSGFFIIPHGPATVHITDSHFYNNNNGSSVLIKPLSGDSTVNVHIRNVRFEHNLHGLFVDGTASTAGIVVNMAESAAVDNQSNGIGTYTGSGNVVVAVTNSQISGNLNAGIGTLGVGPAVVAVRIGNSQITGNNWGVLNGGSGQIQTLGGNQLHTNVNDGTFTGSIATK